MVAVLGCGSPLRGDDAAGFAVAERLLGFNDVACDVHAACNSRNVRVFLGDVSPENKTGEIKRFNPDLLLIIDAVDMGLEPGAVRIIPTDEIGGVSFSSHILPLPIMMDYLYREVGCLILLLGIQAKSLEFMADMTPDVVDAVNVLVCELRVLLT